MSKSKVRRDGRKTRAAKNRAAKTRAELKASRFLGVHLSGGKNDKTAMAVIEYFSSHDKLFLSHLHEGIKTEKEVSADLFLYELLTGTYQSVETIALNCPMSLPLCVTCELECPGFEACGEDHIEWLWGFYRRYSKKKKSLKLFTPYTQRCAESALTEIVDPPFSLDEAFGSNLAPLSTRAHFLQRRLEDRDFIEVNTRLSVWMIGQAIRCSKSNLKTYAHVVHGRDARAYILERLVEKNIIFLYQQDILKLTENLQAFEALFTALTAYYFSKKSFIKKPKGFPNDEAWPIVPEI